MIYKIVLKTEADEELEELSNRERILVFKQYIKRENKSDKCQKDEYKREETL